MSNVISNMYFTNQQNALKIDLYRVAPFVIDTDLKNALSP